MELYPSPARVIVRQSEDGGRAAAGVRLLRAAAPADPDSPAWRMWLPHVLAVTDPARRLDDVVLDVGWLLSSAGSYLRARGEARAARALFEDAHELYRRRLGPDHPDTIAAARALADDLEALGRQETRPLGAAAGRPAPSREDPRQRPVGAGHHDAVFTEYFDPDVFVARQRITGDPGIDPDVPLELRVEFTKTGRNGTLVRIIQGPYEPDVAGFHSRGLGAGARPPRGPPGRGPASKGVRS